MAAVLKEVPVDEWCELRDSFIGNWPRHFLAYSAIDNLLELFKRTPNPVSAAKIFSLNGDWSDGTFILQNGYRIIVYTLEESQERLKEALLLFDWSFGPNVYPYNSRFRETLNYVRVNELGLRVLSDSPTQGLWLSKETARNITIKPPDDVYVAPLRSEDAILANSLWTNAFDGSDVFLRNLIETNMTRGVFGKENHDIRAWVFRLHTGVLTALQVLPAHFRKGEPDYIGYGHLALCAISRAGAEEGRDTFGCVNDDNVASLRTFYKCGFKTIGTFYWSKSEPF